MRPATRILTGLAIACAANVLMWLAIFVKPRMASREDLTLPFTALFLLGVGCALAGVVAALAFAKSPTVWNFLWFFVCVLILNVYGFFWCIGSAVRLIS